MFYYRKLQSHAKEEYTSNEIHALIAQLLAVTYRGHSVSFITLPHTAPLTNRIL